MSLRPGCFSPGMGMEIIIGHFVLLAFSAALNRHVFYCCFWALQSRDSPAASLLPNRSIRSNIALELSR